MSIETVVLDRLGLAAGLALSLKATLVLAIGAAAAWLLRRRSAAARHFVWLLTLTAVLGVTAFATLPHGLAVAVPLWPQWASPRVAASPPIARQRVVADAPAAPGLPDAPAAYGVKDAPLGRPMVTHEATGVTRDADGHESANGATALATRPLPIRSAAVASPGSLLIVVWLAGMVLVLGWLALGHVGLARIARRSEAVEDPIWRTLLRRLAAEAGVAQAPRLCWSAVVGAPLACGLLRPSILLPVEAGSWGPERCRVVLLHELAHIARRDPLTQSIAWLACAIYWFQPAAWLAFARLRAESERACDDRVLSSGVAAPDYASHLLTIARRARALRLAGAVSVAMARRSTLEGRLLALLDDGARRGALGVRARGAGIAALALVLVALGLVRPVPPAAAVAPAVSSESDPAAAPAAKPNQSPAARRAEAIPAEPAAGLATNPSATPAADQSPAPAVDQSPAPAAESAEAGAAVAQSVAETFEVAGDEAKAGAEPFAMDQPAKPADTLVPASRSGAAPTRPPFTGVLLPVPLVSAPAPGPVPGPPPGPPPGGARTWNNPASSLWSIPANWTPADVPDAAGESAVLPALSAAYQVTLDFSPTLDAIQIDATDATLDVNGFSINGAKLVNNSGTIKNFAGVYNSGKIRNLKGGTVLVAPEGTIQVGANDLWNAGTIVAAREIHWGGSVLLHGGGALVLNDTRLLDPNVDQEVTDQFNRQLTITRGTTLRGTGVVYKQLIQNSGLIQADVAAPELWFNGSIHNYGTIRVLNGGHINVNRPSIYNANGLITSGPGGGSVRLEMPFKRFGSISALPVSYRTPATAGFIRADGGDLHIGVWTMEDARFQRGPGGGVVKLDQGTLQNPVVEAGAEVVADWFDLQAAGSHMTNNGTVRLRKAMGVGGPESPAPISIDGTGELILEGSTIGTGWGGTFVNRAGHTIRGCGTINPPFINEGTVSLDCGGGRSARIGGLVLPRGVVPAGLIVNRGRISIARGDLSIAGPAQPRYLIEVATPTVVSNKGTISAAGGNITLEKGVTLDNAGGGMLSAAGGRVFLGGTAGATVIGGKLDASKGSVKAQERSMLRDLPGPDIADFQVSTTVTLKDVTLTRAATLVTAAGGITTVAGARFVNEGINRVAGTLVVARGTEYVQTAGATIVDGGTISGGRDLQILGGVLEGAGTTASKQVTSPTSVPAAMTLRFYARSDASFVLELPQAAELSGRVYDAAGREVARIADGAREAGVYRFALGRSGGAGLPNGIYFGRMVVTSAGVRDVLQSRIAVVD